MILCPDKNWGIKKQNSDYSGVIKWRKKKLMHLWDYNGIDFWLIHKINTIEQSIWQSAKRKLWNEITLQMNTNLQNIVGHPAG